MRRSRIMAGMALAAGLAGLGVSAAPAAETAWFVLRRETGPSCWVALLTRVGGEYLRGNALIAAGPLKSEEEARKALADLERRGICRRG